MVEIIICHTSFPLSLSLHSFRFILIVKNVSYSDAGVYKCSNVLAVEVIVLSSPICMPQQLPLLEGQEVSVTCEVRTSTAGVHQRRPFCRHSFIIIIIIIVVVVVIVGHLKSLQPQKPRFSSFVSNTGPMDGPTD